MCGSDSSIRIEPAENGLTIDAYTPGNGDRPGNHRKLVASSADHALRLLRPHLARIGKKKARGHSVGEAVAQAPKKRTTRRKRSR